MIRKKILGIAVILGITTIGFTNAYDTVDCGNNGYGQYKCALIQPNEYVVMGSYTNSIQNFFNFYNREQENIFEIETYGQKDIIFWSGEDLLDIRGRGQYGRITEYKYNNVCKYNGTDYTGAITTCEDEINYRLPIKDFITEYKGKNVQNYLTWNKTFDIGFSDGLEICGIYDTSTICIKVHYDNTSTYHNNVWTTVQYINDTQLTTERLQQNYNITTSPLIGQNNGGGGDGSDEIPENGFPNTNRGVYDAYGEAGYYKGLCYSDFSINSLATLSGGLQQFYEIEREDGEYYTGAKITDLRLYYGSGQDFSSWFNYWYIQYKNSLALSTTNVNPAVNYVGKSKGLWYMIYKYYGAGLGNSNINYTKLYNFCSYFQDFNLDDGTADSEYSGSDLPDEVSLLIQNNLQFGTGILGHFTGDDLSFDAESFFYELTTRLNDLLSPSDSSYGGVIPSYILMVLMALIFIRLISH